MSGLQPFPRIILLNISIVFGSFCLATISYRLHLAHSNNSSNVVRLFSVTSSDTHVQCSSGLLLLFSRISFPTYSKPLVLICCIFFCGPVPVVSQKPDPKHFVGLMAYYSCHLPTFLNIIRSSWSSLEDHWYCNPGSIFAN